MQTFLTIIGGLASSAVLLILAALAIQVLRNKADHAREMFIKAKIANMARWCGHEFPIMDEIEWYLNDDETGIDEFREHLRAMLRRGELEMKREVEP